MALHIIIMAKIDLLAAERRRINWCAVFGPIRLTIIRNKINYRNIYVRTI